MVNRHKIRIIILAVFVTVVFFYFWLRPGNSPSDNPEKSTVQGQTQEFMAVNGKRVSEDFSKRRPMAVMIENHPDARPQSGLSQADIVYETLAEGGITRLLALYQTNEAKEIGPVRSAREYFASLANEWGALYAHVGGSNEVIVQLKAGKYKNLADANEYYNGDFFPRRKDRPQPHHIFTSSQKLRELMESHQLSNVANFEPWQFKADEPSAMATVEKISLDFSRPGYEVGWEYDKLSNSYKRTQYFVPHLDAETKTQISAKVVIAQIVKVAPVPKDSLLQVDIDLDTGGQAVVFQDGIAMEGSWQKQFGRTRFYTEQNKEIKFNQGVVWVELLPQEKEAGLLWE